MLTIIKNYYHFLLPENGNRKLTRIKFCKNIFGIFINWLRIGTKWIKAFYLFTMILIAGSCWNVKMLNGKI